MRITSAPAGDAPLEIRELWVGAEIPFIVLEKPNYASELFSGEPLEPFVGFIVWQSDALESLDRICPEAATWWRKVGFPKIQGQFIFNVECAEIIE